MKYKIAISSMALSRKLPPGDPRWARFNDSFVNQELEAMDIVNAIYLGHAYTTWHEGRRSIEHFLCGQHFAIDMDSGDSRSSIDVLRQHEFVRTYASFIHTTPSHTDESPRARVVFLLDSCICDAAAYQAAARFLTGIFDGSDTACTDASRFFYGSPNCQIEYLGHCLPLTHLRRYYKQHKDKLPRRPIPVAVAEPVETQLETRIADEPDKLAELEAALKHVDPWAIDYKTWIGMIAAMKREGVPLSIAKEWASGEDGEVEREWKRLHTERPTKMTLRSVFRYAIDNGWQSGKQH